MGNYWKSAFAVLTVDTLKNLVNRAGFAVTQLNKEHILERLLNIQIERHTTGMMVMAGGTSHGYADGKDTLVPIAYLDGTSAFKGAFVFCTIDDSGSAELVGDVYATVIYSLDGGTTRVPLCDPTLLADVGTQIVPTVTDIPAQAMLAVEFSALAGATVRCQGVVEVVRTGLPA